MATTTGEIADSVLGLKTRLDELFAANGWQRTTPMSEIFGGSAPQVTTEAIGGLAEAVARRVRVLTKDEMALNGLGTYLNSVPAQAAAITFANINGDPEAVVGGAMDFLQALAGQLPSPPVPKPQVDWEQIKDKELLPKDLSRRLRAMEAKLKDLEPRSEALQAQIADIEAAHTAADQLPTDLDELARQRAALNEIVKDAEKLAAQITTDSDAATDAMKKITEADARAGGLIERSEQALRGSTGVGLAAAFERRKESLTRAGLYWTLGLVAALAAALFIGFERVTVLKDVLVSDRSPTVIWVNALLAVLGIGAPVWFGWLATKQVWTNFRLAEDYAYKASVSKAYEGYRAEAVGIDPALQTRLFESALTRLEEAPIRLLDMEAHGSPLHELISNPNIRKALEGIPGIADKIVALIPTKAGVAAAIVAPVIAEATGPTKSAEPREE